MASVASHVPPSSNASTAAKATSGTSSTPTTTTTPRDFLSGVSLWDVMQTIKPGPAHKVISVREDDSVEVALRFMDTHNISSIGVTRHGSHPGVAPQGIPTSNEESPIIGMLQLYDVLVPMILHPVWTRVHEYHRELKTRGMNEDKKDRFALEQLLQQTMDKDIFQKPVRSCVGFSNETSQLYMMACNAKLSDVLSSFGTSGIHRALLVHNHQERHLPYQQLQPEIISQIDIIAFLYQSHARLGSVMSESVTTLGLADSNKKMITITEKQTAWDAFMALNDDTQFTNRDHLNAIPVVASCSHNVPVAEDETDRDNAGADTSPIVLPAGRLLGSLSVSDMRTLRADNVQTLMLPVLDFLKWHYPSRQSSVFQVSCPATASLLDVLTLIMENVVHRVWIVNKQNQPIGVVTLSDICDTLYKRANLINK